MSGRDDDGGGAPGHERLAALCHRLTERAPELGPEGRRLIDHITTEVRDGRSPEELEDSFDELEDLLLAAGFTAGLGSYRTDTPPVYQRFPGAGHPLLHVLACPGGGCARVEAPEPESPAQCRIFGRPLREIRLRP
ncbi:hypothetical protein [Streptomyces sp. NRRL F-2799]|uniref:hypothetical protein n=1 Tax=Streptomyces sp. NRRL F-2799 TaxID=1463844 RepID=UPI0004CA5577|nr:hypothetical protein [Streptomyces sp. NRRL F-2799]